MEWVTWMGHSGVGPSVGGQSRLCLGIDRFPTVKWKAIGIFGVPGASWVLLARPSADFQIESDFYELGEFTSPASDRWLLIDTEQILTGNGLFRRVAIGIVDIFDVIDDDTSVEVAVAIDMQATGCLEKAGLTIDDFATQCRI